MECVWVGWREGVGRRVVGGGDISQEQIGKPDVGGHGNAEMITVHEWEWGWVWSWGGDG